MDINNQNPYSASIYVRKPSALVKENWIANELPI
jgi:hypothetical protein